MLNAKYNFSADCRLLFFLFLSLSLVLMIFPPLLLFKASRVLVSLTSLEKNAVSTLYHIVRCSDPIVVYAFQNGHYDLIE